MPTKAIQRNYFVKIQKKSEKEEKVSMGKIENEQQDDK